jgi:hypothetical protein
LLKSAVLVTYNDILRRRPTLADLRAILTRYTRREVIALLGTMNCLLGTWQNEPQFEIDAKLSALLLRDYDYQIRSLRTSQAARLVFSRLTLLYLAKQACLTCPEGGLTVNNPRAHAEVGLCCLMANDLLLPFMPNPSDGTLERIVSLMPFSNYVPHDHYAFDMARTQMIFDEILHDPVLQARPDFLNLGAMFEEKMGIPYVTFCEMIFGCATKYMRLDINALEGSPANIVIRDTFFEKTDLPKEAIREFFKRIAIEERALTGKVVLASKDRPDNDLTVFQAFPLVQFVDGAYMCLDPGFLADKAGRGLYWALFSELKENRPRKNLADFWGAVFEVYVNHILGAAYSAGGRFIPSPRFPNGDEAFDACLLEGRFLVVFEHKSSTIRADAKYSGDVPRLRDQLARKLVHGEPGDTKGLAQLTKSLTRFIGGESISGINCSEIRRIYPVLVCLDDVVLVPYVGRYLNEQFRLMRPNKQFRTLVSPVFSLGISDVENLTGYLGSFKLVDILESFYYGNREMITGLSLSEVPLLKNIPAGPSAVRERFSRFSDEMVKHLFGNRSEEEKANQTPGV